jgi:hypothetical protein
VNESPKAEARSAEHQLPPGFVLVLCAALGGGLPAGIFTTLATEPGRPGSPVYGLLLPWGILPFFLVIVSGWRGRMSTEVRRLGLYTLVAAVLGLLAYGYAFLFLPRIADARKWFLFVPLWQWALIARPALRCALQRSPSPAAREGDEPSGSSRIPRGPG